MQILFYYPSNKRTNSLETVMLLMKEKGLQVHLLTLSERGALHEYLEGHGVHVLSHVINHKLKIKYFFSHINFLVNYCNNNKIDVVFSHLQQANIIAVLAQFFSNSKFFIFRHHFKFHQGLTDKSLVVNRNEIIADRIINKLSDKIIVPSRGVYDGMIAFENVKKDKLEIIPYVYDFSNYQLVSEKRIKQIKERYRGRLLIVMVARLTPFKRHIVALRVFDKLIKKGYDIQVVILDEGEEKEGLVNFVREQNLHKNIHLVGYQRNVLEYLAAGDLLVHPSLTEASNSVVKEAGFVGTPVVICEGVGDFDDYIIDGVNSFAIRRGYVEEDLFQVLEQAYSNPELLNKYAELLRKEVKFRFGKNEDAVLAGYQKLLAQA